MKSRLLLLSIFFCICSIAVLAQENNETRIRYLNTFGKIDLGFSGLGLSLETPLSHRVLLEFAAGIGAGYKINEDFKYRFYFDDPAVFVSLNGKYYYNQQRRVDHKRPVSFNAGNFFGIKIKYASPTLIDQKTWNTLLTGFHWGMQRKMGRHFLYQFNVGIGSSIDLESNTSTHITLFPDVNFRVSYVLPF